MRSILARAGKGERFAAEGASVNVWDRNAESLGHAAAALGSKHRCLEVDVTNERAAVDAFRGFTAQFNRLDIFVNNAGINGPTKPITDYSGEDWKAVIDVNLTAAFYCSREATRLMTPHGRGRIINIASIAGKEGNPLIGYDASETSLSWRRAH